MSCKCDVGLSNTGTACTPIQSVQKKIVVVPYRDSNGNVNEIDVNATTFDSAYFTARVNDTDRTKRWFPLPQMKNIVDERGDDIREEFEDGTSVFIQQGARTFTGVVIEEWGNSPQFLAKLRDVSCVEVGVFIIDKDENLIGAERNAGFLAPIRLDKDSFSPRLMKPTDSTIQKVQINFNFHPDENDGDLRMVTSDEMTFDVSGLRGLLDITSTYSAISTTGFTATLKTQYGTILTPVLDSGLVIGDFALFNVTTSLAVTILTLTESPDGVYAFTFAAQSSSDQLRLTPTKNGRDYTAVVANLVNIP